MESRIYVLSSTSASSSSVNELEVAGLFGWTWEANAHLLILLKEFLYLQGAYLKPSCDITEGTSCRSLRLCQMIDSSLSDATRVGSRVEVTSG